MLEDKQLSFSAFSERPRRGHRALDQMNIAWVRQLGLVRQFWMACLRALSSNALYIAHRV